jgi:hypothetical protein
MLHEADPWPSACHAPQFRLTTSRAVGYPQVRRGAASEGVGCRLAKTGVVGTWLGTGFRTSRTRGGPKMAIQISDDFMILEVNSEVVATALQRVRGCGRQRSVDRLDPPRSAVQP